MKNSRVKVSLNVLHLVTASTIYEHFQEQQQHALARGRINQTVSAQKLKAYSEECHKSLKRELRKCGTPQDVAIVERALVKQMSPKKIGFLGAVWLGSRKQTLNALNDE